MTSNDHTSDEKPLLSRSESHGEPLSDQTLPFIIGYRVIRLLGEGGMGVVYEAWQEKPYRRVALKLLRPGLMTPTLLRRFGMEVEILGRLEHPAIARIYEAGSSESGGIIQPYFAMEYLEGLPVTRYAQENDLSVRERVLLMKKIVDGVHHAHQKGVIHRDLKPANILVGEQGQPRILDFGVARIFDSDVQVNTLTLDAGVLLGTLAYMAPEQADGKTNEVDIRSDVYSLGMIAFELLSGERPYRIDTSSIHETVRLIHEQEPARLGTVDRSLKGDLEIIVSKAIEKEKDRRYNAAAALADDFQHYLDDEPINARAPSARYQIAKFARRHKVLMGAGTATFLALTIGLALASTGLIRARIAEEEARRAEAHAIQERGRAQNNLRKALDTVDQFMTHVAQRLLVNIPEAAPIRAQLLRDAVAFYEQLTADNEGDIQLREELGWALTRLADASRNTDRQDDSGDLWRQRISQLNGLLETDPAHPEYLRDLARSWNNLGGVLRQTGQFTEAREAHEQALDILRRLVDLEPDVLEYQRDFARTWEEFGKLLVLVPDITAALNAVDQALTITQGLADRHRQNPEFQRDLARSWMELGSVHVRARDISSAEVAFQRANAIYRRVVDMVPENPEYQIDLARSWSELGTIHTQTENYSAALQAFERADILFLGLSQRYPQNADYARGLARNWDERGRMHRRTGDYDAASAAHARAIALLRDLTDQYPDQSDYRRELARSLAERAQTMDSAGESADAIQSFDEAFRHYTQLLREHPTSRGLRTDLAYMLGNWARMLSENEAYDKLESARTLWIALSRDYPRNDSIRKALVWTEEQMARHRSSADTVLERTRSTRPLLRLDAMDTGGLREAAGHYASVRGRIRSIQREIGRNQLTFIHFGTKRLQFSALIHRNVLPTFTGVYGEQFQQLTGQDVEIEGILSLFKGNPQMVLNRPDQIHLLANALVDSSLPIIPSYSVDEILAHGENPVIIEGRVSRVNATANDAITFLEFENKKGKKFTAVIRADRLAIIENALGGSLANVLPGRIVRISGPPYLHHGNPNIEIRELEQLVILPDS